MVSLRVTISLFAAMLLVAAGAGAQTPDGAPADWPEPVPDLDFYGMLLVDQFEYRATNEEDLIAWEVAGWYGGDVNRLFFKSEGGRRTSSPTAGDAELQLLYSRLILPFWEVQLGVRQDFNDGPGPDRQRTFAVIGLEGLAPQRFVAEPALFISDEGDVSFRFEGTYDLFVTQRLVAQPRFEFDLAFSDAADFGVQSGFNDVVFGLRLRYEIRRELAPYVGFNWSRKLGDTADQARDEGEQVDDLSFVAGVRFWF